LDRALAAVTWLDLFRNLRLDGERRAMQTAMQEAQAQRNDLSRRLAN
jgi:seryl-tRNA synthetase